MYDGRIMIAVRPGDEEKATSAKRRMVKIFEKRERTAADRSYEFPKNYDWASHEKFENLHELKKDQRFESPFTPQQFDLVKIGMRDDSIFEKATERATHSDFNKNHFPSWCCEGTTSTCRRTCESCWQRL